ncbi:MAG TPA: sugar phosphate nucleotidyltransferase [Candidatus Woesearchaeota archaeon]|nr:sugar phosphate nucleotidyltransferase [Candidatus Woesearchaeota archaeon]
MKKLTKRPFQSKEVSKLQAIIPAAGVGTRLRPHTHTLPKALITVGGKPIIAHILDSLIKVGVDDVVVIIGYLGDKIKDYIEKSYPGLKSTFVEQKERKGLGHAIGMAKQYIFSPVIIIYGDTLFEGDISQGLMCGCDGAIGTKVVDDPRRFGVVEKSGEYITKLVEKPDYIKPSEVIVGVNYIKDFEMMFKAIDYIIENNITLKGEYQLTDAFEMMVEWGAKIKTFPIENWFDCGTAQALIETNRHILKKHSNTSTPVVFKGNILIPPVFISKSSKIIKSIIGPYVTVSDDCEITNSIISDSIINEGAKVEDIVITESILGNYSVTKGNVEKVNIGENSEVEFK